MAPTIVRDGQFRLLDDLLLRLLLLLIQRRKGLLQLLLNKLRDLIRVEL